MTRLSSRTSMLARAGLLASLLAASAWIVVPVGPVPVTLQVLIIVLIALLSTPLWAAATVATYLALGAAGLPVFSAGGAGVGVLFGPTGGYLTGFLLAAVAGAWVRGVCGKQKFADIAAAAVCIVVTYTVGTLQLAAVANLSPLAAIGAGVLPFIAIDVVKAAVATVIAAAIRRAGAAVSLGSQAA